MEKKDIRNAVLSHLAVMGTKYVPAGVSARHVHLSREDLEKILTQRFKGRVLELNQKAFAMGREAARKGGAV